MRIFIVLFAATVSLAALAQTPAAPAATAVNPDGSITFRYTNGGAQAVIVETDAVPKPLPMQKGESGVWTASTPPLKAEHYGYSFRVDGVPMRDPLNPAIRPNLVGLYNDILVPGHPAEPWEFTAIPHGSITKNVYATKVAQNLPENQETYYVYTPPGYDPGHPGGYPVLYLLHGWSDGAEGWTAVGQANLILDTLLSQGKIVPMIVVMPQGYGDYTFVNSGHDVWDTPAKVEDNVYLYSQMLISEILPAVEKTYSVAKDRNHRAIAGLSMGGLEALSIGLTSHEIFGYVAGMSSAVHGEHFDEHFPEFAAASTAKTADLKLLWVGCGTEDGLITPNRHFVAWAKGKGLPVTAVEMPGQHTWLVWRQDLLTVAPLLFR